MRIAPAGDGAMSVEIAAPEGVAATGAAFVAAQDERFYGTGERSDAVDRRGRETESYVADGPFRREDRQYVQASVPPWAERDRDDATYFPVPWVLSSRGWGVLVDEDVTSRVRAAVDRPTAGSVDADGARLRLRVFAGPTPARRARGASRRRSAASRAPQAPWTFGPWFQTGQPNVVPPEEEREIVKAQRDAGVPVSVAETQMHHLPCGAHEGREEAERERTAAFHRDGLARLVYFNPSLCVSYREVYDRAAAAGVLQKGPAARRSPTRRSSAAPGRSASRRSRSRSSTSPHPATEDVLRRAGREAVELGADGWMEDFGESTPPARRPARRHAPATPPHNRYPVDYHCALQRIAARFDRPLVRFQRSGWTGAARCAEVVWGGDPTTVWGFDGLSSAATQVLSIGLSGIARWGTDIGGYNSFGAGFDAKPGATEDETLTPELLTRWIELGALVPVMRTKRSGIAIPSYDRPQVFDPEHLPVWQRLTELHHQLNPYLLRRRRGAPPQRPADRPPPRARAPGARGGARRARPVAARPRPARGAGDRGPARERRRGCRPAAGSTGGSARARRGRPHAGPAGAARPPARCSCAPAPSSRCSSRARRRSRRTATLPRPGPDVTCSPCRAGRRSAGSATA